MQIRSIEFAEAFEAIWNELKSIMGSASTIALVRRAVEISSESCPRLMSITFKPTGHQFTYEFPFDASDQTEWNDELYKFTETVFELTRKIAGDVLVGYLLKNPVIRKYVGEVYDKDQ